MGALGEVTKDNRTALLLRMGFSRMLSTETASLEGLPMLSAARSAPGSKQQVFYKIVRTYHAGS